MNRGCVDLESTFEGEPDRTLKEMDQTAVQFFGFLRKAKPIGMGTKPILTSHDR